MRKKAKHGSGWIAFGYQFHTVNGKPKRWHVHLAEQAIGHELPPNAVVHHVDGDKMNNINSNLVVCPSESYHRLLHIRTRAYEETGNAGWRKCKYCCQWDDLANMSSYRQYTSGLAAYHKACAAKYAKDRRTQRA
jgi:hypothetical protein